MTTFTRPVPRSRPPGRPIGTRTVLALCLGSLPSFAMAAGRDLDAHEHGAAALDVALDGARLYVDLDSPADNLLGFEHAPSDDAQRARVAEADRTLRDDAILVANAEAACTLEEASVDIALPSGDDAHADGHDEDHGSDHDGDHDGDDHDAEHDHDGESTHADVSVAHVLLCENPDALRTLTTTLFERFDGFVDIDVQLVGPGGQDGARLTADAPVISLESIL